MEPGPYFSGLTRPFSCATFCSATMFSARKPRKLLSELEHLVMGVVWNRESVTADDVRAALAERHPMKESTVRTVSSASKKKGTCDTGWTAGPISIAAWMRRRMLLQKQFGRSSNDFAAARWSSCSSAWLPTTSWTNRNSNGWRKESRLAGSRKEREMEPSFNFLAYLAGV